MKQYPDVRLIYDRRKETVKKKDGCVEIEIYLQGKRKWISTGVRISSNNWTPKNNKVIGRIDSLDLNLKIDAILDYINCYIRQLMIDKKEFTWDGLHTHLEKQKIQNSFIDFVETRLAARKDLTKNSIKNHKKFVTALKEFGKIQNFEDLSRQRVKEYDEWLRNRRNYIQSTIAEYHKYLKIYIHDAIRQELITLNPYDGFKVDRGKTRTRKYLTQDEVLKLENAKLPTDSLNKVRDLFLFQCHTGMAYTDMARFDYRKVEKKGDRYIYHDIRQKTSEDFYIVLLPKAVEILKKYNDELPIISNYQYNLRLKVVAEAAGIEKNITTHMGRHTYATMCLNAGIPIEVLAQMLGHSNIKTTQIYAKLVNKTVEDSYDVLEQYLIKSN